MAAVNRKMKNNMCIISIQFHKENKLSSLTKSTMAWFLFLHTNFHGLVTTVRSQFVWFTLIKSEYTVKLANIICYRNSSTTLILPQK